MLDIPQKNETIFSVIYNVLTSPEKLPKHVKEFGFYEYAAFAESKDNPLSVIICTKFADFKKIYQDGGKEFIENYFKDIQIIPNYKDDKGKEYDLGLKVSLETYKKLFEKKGKKAKEDENKTLDDDIKSLKTLLDELAMKLAGKVAEFRVKLYSNLFNKKLLAISSGKEATPITVHLNAKNTLTLLPAGDKLQAIYGIDFLQDKDKDLTKIFLQELCESKRHVKRCIDVQIFNTNSNTPKNILDHVKPEDYSNGLCAFDLYGKNYETLKNIFGTLVTFREYIQFHIHSIKAFLHIRMNKIGKEITDKLNNCRIVPDNCLKKLEVVNFYFNFENQADKLKLFTEDFQKVNV